MDFRISDDEARPRTAVLSLSSPAQSAGLEEAWAETIQEERGIPLTMKEVFSPNSEESTEP